MIFTSVRNLLMLEDYLLNMLFLQRNDLNLFLLLPDNVNRQQHLQDQYEEYVLYNQELVLQQIYVDHLYHFNNNKKTIICVDFCFLYFFVNPRSDCKLDDNQENVLLLFHYLNSVFQDEQKSYFVILQLEFLLVHKQLLFRINIHHFQHDIDYQVDIFFEECNLI